MHRGPRGGAILTVAVLAMTACGATSESVSTATLTPAASAALDCAASINQRLDTDLAVVFLEPTATREQTEAVRSALQADSAVGPLTYVSQDDAYAEFKALFADSPQMVNSVEPRLLPASFRFNYVVDTPPTSAVDPLARYRSLPGVKEVVTGASPPGCSDADPAMLAAAKRAIDDRFGDSDLIVFIQPGAADKALEVQDRLLSMPAAHGIRYLSQDDAMLEFSCIFRDNPEMVDSVTKEILPPSFRIDVGHDPAVIATTGDAIKNSAFVKVVVERPTPSSIVGRRDAAPDSGGSSFITNNGCRVDGQRIK